MSRNKTYGDINCQKSTILLATMMFPDSVKKKSDKEDIEDKISFLNITRFGLKKNLG